MPHPITYSSHLSPSRHPFRRPSRPRGFTLLELVTGIAVLSIMALIAVVSFRGVFRETTAQVVGTTADTVVDNARMLAGFNASTSTNVVSNVNVDAAVAELIIDPNSGWSTNTAAADGAVIALQRGGEICSSVITVSAGDVSRSEPSCSKLLAAGDPSSLSLSYATTEFSRAGSSQLVPSLSGGTALSYTFTGSLPAGVNFDSATGVFLGPTAWNVDVVDVSVGESHACALTSTGSVLCWGGNFAGQLGDGTSSDRLEPTQVIGLSGVAQISAGANHTCARTTAGAVWCWGFNTYGQLGNGSTLQRLSPVQVTGLSSGVAEVSAGANHTCARTVPGAVRCWGADMAGQIGAGENNAPMCSLSLCRTTPTAVVGLTTGVIDVAAGVDHTCALNGSTAVLCWGSNASGGLGDGSTVGSNTPVNVTGLPSGIAQVAAGAGHSCARSTSAVFCWGSNASGQLGNGSTTDSSVPVELDGLTSGGVDLSAGSFAGTGHSCSVSASGVVSCWGSNLAGQLGNGSTTDSSVPVELDGLTASRVSTGSATCVVATGGAIRCWGPNLAGQLGNGSTTDSSVPADVANLSGNTGFPASGSVEVFSIAGATASANVVLTLAP